MLGVTLLFYAAGFGRVHVYSMNFGVVWQRFLAFGVRFCTVLDVCDLLDIITPDTLFYIWIHDLCFA